MLYFGLVRIDLLWYCWPLAADEYEQQLRKLPALRFDRVHAISARRKTQFQIRPQGAMCI